MHNREMMILYLCMLPSILPALVRFIQASLRPNHYRVAASGSRMEGGQPCMLTSLPFKLYKTTSFELSAER